VLEFLQRFLHSLVDVIGLRAGPKMQQQFAHIGNAFLQAAVEFTQGRGSFSTVIF